MGLSVLNDLQDRLYNSIMAGSNIVAEDFRLRRAIEQLGETAETSPVLRKIYGMVKPLLDNDCKKNSEILLESAALVDAVLYTQGMSQIKGDMSEIKILENGEYHNIRYSQMMPLHNALTTKGGGRLEVLQDMYHENSEFLTDFRIKPDLVYALGDSYSEVADLAEEVLKNTDTKLIPLLKKNLDSVENKIGARRIRIIEKLAKGEENDFYISLLEDKSPAMKEAAILALRNSIKNVDILLDLAKSEKGIYKKAALMALGYIDDPKANEYWIKNYSKKLLSAKDYLAMNKSKVISEMIGQVLINKLNEVIELSKSQNIVNKVGSAIKGTQKSEITEYLDFTNLLEMVFNKESDKIFEFLELVAKNKRILSKIKWSIDRNIDVLDVIDDNILNTMISTKSINYKEKIKALYHKYDTMFIKGALLSYLLTEPENAFDIFSKYFSKKQYKWSVLNCLKSIKYDKKINQYCILRYFYNTNLGNIEVHASLGDKFDTRWIKLLSEEFSQNSGKSTWDSGVLGFMRDLININDNESLEVLKDFFVREGKRHCGTYIYIQSLLECGYKDFRGLLHLQFLDNYIYINRYDAYDIYKRGTELGMAEEDICTEIECYISSLEKEKKKGWETVTEKLKAELADIRKIGI